MACRSRDLVILAALALAGCGGSVPNFSLPNVSTKNDYKGKPGSVLLARMGNPDYQQTISGQKFYMWRIGVSDRTCLVAAGLSGDIVDSYNATGDIGICGPYLPPAQPVAAQ